MVHAPIDIENRFDQWKALENLKDDEFTRALGIVNISLIQLMTILKKFEKSPAIFEVWGSIKYSIFLPFYTFLFIYYSWKFILLISKKI